MPAPLVPLEVKMNDRTSVSRTVTKEGELKTYDYILDDLLAADYAATPPGTFRNLDRLVLRWVRPDWFEYHPDPERPLQFERSTGETIVPGRMFTDGGSIPRWFWVSKNLSPWCYAPAFIVHDWEFDRHHAGASSKSFDAVRDTIAEAIKSLMETNACPKSEADFRLIYAGVSSWIAKDIWNKSS